MPKKEMNTLVVGTNEYEIVDSTARSSISSKQDILVSGTNIKTINGSSILGSGDLVVNSANDGVLTIQKNGTTVTTFSANQSTDVTANITVPTDASDIDYQYGGSLTPVQQATNVQDALDNLDDFVNGLDSGKQDTLVSGTNIKTINGSSILGSGDLTVNSANDGVLTLTENGVTVDTFTANQSTNTTVDFGNLAFYNADTLASGVDAVKVAFDMDLLWENANPANNFSAQDVSIDLSEYRLTLIKFKTTTTSTGCTWCFAMVDGTRILALIVSDYIYYRPLIVSQTSISFESGYQTSTYGTPTSTNSRMIPICVYGIK